MTFFISATHRYNNMPPSGHPKDRRHLHFVLLLKDQDCGLVGKEESAGSCDQFEFPSHPESDHSELDFDKIQFIK